MEEEPTSAMEISEDSTTTSAKTTTALAGKPSLPTSRVKTIMKSAPDSMSISQDAAYLVARATEHFIAHLCTSAYGSQASDGKLDYGNQASGGKLDYGDLSHLVASDGALRFLKDVVPKKVLVRDYFASLQQQKASSNS